MARELQISMSALGRWRRDPAMRFPKAYVLSPQVVVFLRDEILAWVRSRQDAPVDTPRVPLDGARQDDDLSKKVYVVARAELLEWLERQRTPAPPPEPARDPAAA